MAYQYRDTFLPAIAQLTQYLAQTNREDEQRAKKFQMAKLITKAGAMFSGAKNSADLAQRQADFAQKIGSDPSAAYLGNTMQDVTREISGILQSKSQEFQEARQDARDVRQDEERSGRLLSAFSQYESAGVPGMKTRQEFLTMSPVEQQSYLGTLEGSLTKFDTAVDSSGGKPVITVTKYNKTTGMPLTSESTMWDPATNSLISGGKPVSRGELALRGYDLDKLQSGIHDFQRQKAADDANRRSEARAERELAGRLQTVYENGMPVSVFVRGEKVVYATGENKGKEVTGDFTTKPVDQGIFSADYGTSSKGMYRQTAQNMKLINDRTAEIANAYKQYVADNMNDTSEVEFTADASGKKITSSMKEYLRSRHPGVFDATDDSKMNGKMGADFWMKEAEQDEVFKRGNPGIFQDVKELKLANARYQFATTKGLAFPQLRKYIGDAAVQYAIDRRKQEPTKTFSEQDFYDLPADKQLKLVENYYLYKKKQAPGMTVRPDSVQTAPLSSNAILKKVQENK